MAAQTPPTPITIHYQHRRWHVHRICHGCTDDTQFNYDPLANTDNGTCIEFIYGRTDSTQFNYNAAANTTMARIEFIYGCTIETTNYDAGANTDDGTCITDCGELLAVMLRNGT